ncbi:MAG: hypothetical protein VKL42_19420 [Snowella sp.]|nr:hypothetical protein [Snowella sp.]
MSDYNTLKTKGLHRGRPRLTEKERQERKKVTAMRQEARRRAGLVLQHRHQKEFDLLVEKEMESLERESR